MGILVYAVGGKSAEKLTKTKLRSVFSWYYTQCTKNSLSSKPLFYKRRHETGTTKNVLCKSPSQLMLQPSCNKWSVLWRLTRGLTNHCSNTLCKLPTYRTELTAVNSLSLDNTTVAQLPRFTQWQGWSLAFPCSHRWCVIKCSHHS